MLNPSRGLTLFQNYLKMDCRATHKTKCVNPEYIIQKNINDFEPGVDILEITQKAQAKKEIISAVDFVKIKRFCPTKKLI